MPRAVSSQLGRSHHCTSSPAPAHLSRPPRTPWLLQVKDWEVRRHLEQRVALGVDRVPLGGVEVRRLVTVERDGDERRQDAAMTREILRDVVPAEAVRARAALEVVAEEEETVAD